MRIGFVASDQQDALVDLLLEIHDYYNPGTTVRRQLVSEHAAENLLSARATHRLIGATRRSGTMVGLAAISLVYSIVDVEPEKRKHCQLKELFVSESERGKGVGGALMAWVAEHAVHNGCHRIDWPVKSTNSRGISFYESLGARRVEERLSYRLSIPSLHTLADGASTPSD